MRHLDFVRFYWSAISRCFTHLKQHLNTDIINLLTPRWITTILVCTITSGAELNKVYISYFEKVILKWYFEFKMYKLISAIVHIFHSLLLFIYVILKLFYLFLANMISFDTSLIREVFFLERTKCRSD